MIPASIILPLAVTAAVLHKRQFESFREPREFEGIGGPDGFKGFPSFKEIISLGVDAKVAGIDNLVPQYRKNAHRTLTKLGRMYPHRHKKALLNLVQPTLSMARPDWAIQPQAAWETLRLWVKSSSSGSKTVSVIVKVHAPSWLGKSASRLPTDPRPIHQPVR